MKYVITLFLLLITSQSYADKIKGEWTNQQILSVLEVADSSDGIDATEARALAEAFFRRTQGSDGGLWSFSRKGEWWWFETLIGKGVVGEPIKIHAKSGLVMKKGGGLAPSPWKKLVSWFKTYKEAEANSKQ